MRDRLTIKDDISSGDFFACEASEDDMVALAIKSGTDPMSVVIITKEEAIRLAKHLLSMAGE
jgi:hypothetical protein